MTVRRSSARIGAGAGFSGDRIEPAIELATHGALDYLVFECLAERTIALAQRARRDDPQSGFDPLLDARIRAVLRPCVDRGVRIVTNMGAANPSGAAGRIAAIARDIGLAGLQIATVTGDDVLAQVLHRDPPLFGEPGRVSDLKRDRILSANAYLGAGPIRDALAAGAQVVVTGRVADSALFLAPLMHEFGWREDDWSLLGRGAMTGHLLECAGQLTGGYFADPGVKDVPGLARLGFPFADVAPDGTAVFGKVAGSGGLIDLRTCTEQLLYEIGDPAAYPTPDVTADFSGVRLRMLGPDRVEASGGDGRPAPAMLKVSVGYTDGYTGEGQISYAGVNAVARGRLALEIIRERLDLTGVPVRDLRCELIGLDATYIGAGLPDLRRQTEVRARVTGRTDTIEAARRIGQEVESLYTTGPAGGGGVTRHAQSVIAIASTLIPRGDVSSDVTLLTA
ncbi:acyclic terpene utilization AtuA family protein [Sphingomonas bacterium]|uniref:acyclic terpene utilization AtuA family protein n=1 Tax=Sphingomonas bacterium TaxID=1895847 RepID=UPI001576D744|nr:acyclic terpene utilization AtuA family protein [Sphingomonas bacterium]